MLDFNKATHAQLNEYVAENNISIDGWVWMAVVEKRTAIAAYPLDAMNDTIVFEDVVEDAPKATVTITITEAQSNPVMLYVHGVGYWSLRIGETYDLPVDAVSALRNSDCKLDEG